MEYVLPGLLLFIGWHAAKLIFEIISEVLFCRLHETNWYRILSGKKPKEKNEKSKGDKSRIGF